jgi:enoyl-CoA hydratase
MNTPIDAGRYARDFPSLQFLAPEAGILELIMSNKGRLNAATEAMHRDLAQVWRTIDSDDAVRVVVVRGEGSNFSSGGDFDMIERMIDDEATLIRVWKEASDLVYNLINCSKPVVSAIRGSAVGAGLAVALLADISIAADNARILDGHTRLGVAAGDHAVIIWPLLCGLAKARYHLLTNKSLSGAEAERIGLIAVAVPDAQVLDSAFDVARTLAAGGSTAIRWTKHALNNWLRLAGPSFDTSLALEFLGFRLADVREGLAAAREKRRPSFDGDKSK